MKKKLNLNYPAYRISHIAYRISHIECITYICAFRIVELLLVEFDPNSCNISIGNEILERIGNDCVNKYFKFVGLKLDEFLNWDFQIEHISNKTASSIFASSQIKNISYQ